MNAGGDSVAGTSGATMSGGGVGATSTAGSAPVEAGSAGALSAGGSGGAAAQGGYAGNAGSAAVFQHPGVLMNGAQLAFLKAKLAAGTEPWKSALAAAKVGQRSSDFAGYPAFASLSYVPHPVPSICCGSVSKPDVGCKAEQFDASAAYTTALIWALTGDDAYAKQALAIMNAYSAVMPKHVPPTELCTGADGTSGLSSNTVVQSGWVGSIFPRAGELMRAYPGWPAADLDKFKTMLRSAYLPNLQVEPPDNGNWELSVADALVQLGVFLDDAATFRQGLSFWRKRVPAYIYLKADGSAPIKIAGANWNASNYFDGLCQETCRDLHHPQLGFAALINAAETARIQGVDLYSEQAPRIMAGLEVEAGYLLQASANQALTPNPGCSTAFPNPAQHSPAPMWEIAFNEYSNRLKQPLPNSAALIARLRPTAVDHHMDWETLTHAEVGAVGIH